MKTIILDALAIAQKDLKELMRDKIRLISFLLMPIFMMSVIGFIFPSKNSLKNVPLAIADQNGTVSSKTIVNLLAKMENDSKEKIFDLQKVKNETEAINLIKKQKVNGGLIIPSDFSQKLNHNQTATITFIEDQANPQISQIIIQTISKIVSHFNLEAGQKRVNLFVKNIQNPLDNSYLKHQIKIQSLSKIIIPNIEVVRLKTKGILPEETNYFEFMAPGIIAMIILTAVLTGLASSVAKEEETGTIDGIMIAPVSRFSIIIGKSLTQATRGIIQGLIILALSMLLFGVKIYGSFWLLLLLMFLGIFSFVGLGILVSAMATRQETATQLLFMFQLPMILLSGVFFPIQQMPKTIQYISKAIPLTYMVNALRKVLVLGADLGAVKTEVGILILCGIVALLVAVPTFRWVMTK